MRVELVDKSLFLSMANALVEIAAWVEAYNRERPHSCPRYATPAAYAAELDERRRGPLRHTGRSAMQPSASTALMRQTGPRL